MKNKTTIYVQVFLMLVLGTSGLAACGENAATALTPEVYTPSPASTAVIAKSTAPDTTAAQATAVPSLPTATPLPSVQATTNSLPSPSPAAATAVPSTGTTGPNGNPNQTLPVPTGPAQVETVIPTQAASQNTGASRIAFVESGSLSIIDVSNKARKTLLQGGTQGVVGNPTWSTDNREIAISFRSNLKVNTSRAQLYRVNVANGENKPFLNDQPANASDTEPLWSPDGTTVAFTRLYSGTDPNNFDPFKSRHEVWLVDANGQNPRKLAAGQQPAWSPDSRRIAFVTNGSIKAGLNSPQINGLHLINAKGQNEWEPMNTAKIPTDFTKFNYPFSGEAYFIQSPVFLDGGKTLAFSTIGATGLVLTINSSSGTELKLWNGQPEGGYGKVISDPKAGPLLMFEGYPPSGFRTVSIIDTSKNAGPDKPALLQIGGPGKGEALYPVWSPDGSQIAYFTVKGGSGEISLNTIGSILVAKVPSGEATELFKGAVSGLAWSR